MERIIEEEVSKGQCLPCEEIAETAQEKQMSFVKKECHMWMQDLFL